jgi:hypothetical protein
LPLWNLEEWRRGDAVDTKAPSTQAARTPGPNAQGWHAGNVEVELVAGDDPGGTGVRDIRYTLTSAQTGGALVPGGRAVIAVSAEGTTTLEYAARDFEGNVEPTRTLTVRIDKTAPLVSCSATPNQLWPPNRRLVPVRVEVTIDDAVSGSGGYVLTAATSDEGAGGDIVGFVAGTAETAGSLRAERDGAGDGRVYTLGYRGFDRAGNEASCAASVEVPRHR